MEDGKGAAGFDHGLWRFEPMVGALQALRGVAAIAAIGLVAAIADLGRSAHPRKLMGHLVLVPFEH